MKIYEASKRIDGTYDIYGSDDSWISQTLEFSCVRGCAVKSKIRHLYKRDFAEITKLIASCKKEKTVDEWFEAIGL